MAKEDKKGIFDSGYLKEFEGFSAGVQGIREKFFLSTGEVEKGIEEVISVSLFGGDKTRIDLFRDSIINKDYFNIESKFDILKDIINRGGLEFDEENERESFIAHIEEVIRMKKLFTLGDIIFSDKTVRIYLNEEGQKTGRIIDEDFFDELNNLVGDSVSILREVADFMLDEEEAEAIEEAIEDELEEISSKLDADFVEVSAEAIEEDEIGEDELEDEEDDFKVDEKDIWKEETGMMDDFEGDYTADEMPDIDATVDGEDEVL